MSNVSINIDSEKNFFANICSLSYKLLSFTISISYLLLRLITTSYENYEGFFNYLTFLRAYFAI